MDKPIEREKKTESGFGRIPKIGDKCTNNHRNHSPQLPDRGRQERDVDRAEKLQREKDRHKLEREKAERERLDRERLEKLKAERERIDRDIDRLNKDREKLDKTRSKLESKPSGEKGSKPIDKNKLISREQNGHKQDIIKKKIDLKSQNTYRIDKNPNDRKSILPNKNSEGKYLNGHSSQGKPTPKLNKEQVSQKLDMKDRVGISKQKTAYDGSPKVNGKVENGKRLPDNNKGMPSKRTDDRGPLGAKSQPGPSKPKISNSFDFDKHVNSLKSTNGMKRPDGSRSFPPGDVKRKSHPDDMRRKQKRKYFGHH